MKFYLAGPVGYGNPGIEWKADIKNLLRTAGHEVWDPIENDCHYSGISEMNELKTNPRQNPNQIHEIMQEIFMDDCAYIKECDYLICYFVGRALGTASEQGIAYFANKFCRKKVKTISIFDYSFRPEEWTLGCSNYAVFSIEECLELLRRLI